MAKWQNIDKFVDDYTIGEFIPTDNLNPPDVSHWGLELVFSVNMDDIKNAVWDDGKYGVEKLLEEKLNEAYARGWAEGIRSLIKEIMTPYVAADLFREIIASGIAQEAGSEKMIKELLPVLIKYEDSDSGVGD